MEHVLTWVASGLFAGWLVRVAMHSRRDFGLAGDLALGSLGGVVGVWLVRHFGVTAPDGHVAHVLVAVTGAALLVGGLRLLKGVVRDAGGPDLDGHSPSEVDLESQMHLLTEFERRVLARVLRRKPTAANPNLAFEAQLTFGERIADRVASFGGSWTFIVMFLTGLVIWMIVNEESSRPLDPFPFILLNLVLSCVAALQAPVIMMSQKRQATKDRLDALHDYEVNLRAEVEIMGLHAKLDAVREREWVDFMNIQQQQLEVLRRLESGLLAEEQSRMPDPM